VTQTGKKGDAPGKKGGTAPAGKERGVSSRASSPVIERYTVRTEFWESLLNALPPWADEIAAITLIIFGIMSFLSLINISADASLSAAWSNALTSLFGVGGVIVCAGLFALGIIILLPKMGIVIRFPARRILALEVVFLAVLALLHLAAGDPELRNLARAGRGGGQVGWALSALVVNLFGSSVAIVLYSILLIVGVGIVIGIKRAHVVSFLSRLHTALAQTAAEWRPAPRPRPQRPSLDEALNPPAKTVIIDESGAPALRHTSEVAGQRARAYSLMHIRPDPDSLPPSLRYSAPTTPNPPGDEEPIAPVTPIDYSQHPLFRRTAEPPTPINIGTMQVVRKKGEQPTITRPDGRVKRFFTVENFKEARQIGKREPELPPLSVLIDSPITVPDDQEINANVLLIENTLLEFDIDVDVVDVRVGPTVTQYLIQPFREKAGEGGEIAFSRTRISKISSLVNDLALSLSAKRLRLETPVPGTNYIGVEVPNRVPSMVALRSVYESKSYYEQLQKKKSPLFIPLGRDVGGEPVGIDLAGMPHLLIAGTTGSGKSVCMAAIVSALVLDNHPNVVKLVLLDPKMVELSRFNGLPHLLGPVETDVERIIGVMRWCTREMDRRYKLLEENAARNIDTYNSRLGRRRRDEFLPYIVIMVDEVGDLMMNHPEETEKTLTRLAQMARAVGMHLVVATQRPSVDVITGLIKANFPSRIAFSVASGTDSRVILDSVGAESLLGRGDMLYQAADMLQPRRVQGCFVSDDEVRDLVAHWKNWVASQAEYRVSRVGPWERGLTRREFLSETDPMLEQAIELVIAEQEASAALIQRRLGLGYPRAARIIDLLEELGVIGKVLPGGRGREVLLKPGKDPFKEIIDRRISK
jgi:S-DNA-T family DNA segregation ATPase FtsK/SpoIIIE